VRSAKLLFLLLTGALLAAAFSYDAVRMRFDVVRHKALGRLPQVAWTELLCDLPQHGLIQSRAALTGGYVKLERGDLGGPCPVLWDTPFGKMRGNIEDEHDLEFYAAKYMGVGHGAREGVLPQIEPGDVAVDVGAWIGAFTRVALSRGAARVVAIEPVPVNIECLRLNFADEIADGRVTLIEKAAWREQAEVGMVREGDWNPQSSTKGYNIVEGGGELRVEAQTLDAMIEDLGLERLDILNLDIEGAERDALPGAERTIARFEPQIIMCTHHKPDDKPLLVNMVLAIHPQYEVRESVLHARFIPKAEELE
jgi:FkbM family methyltransferase